MRGYLSKGLNWLMAADSPADDFVVLGEGLDPGRWRKLVSAAVLHDRLAHLHCLLEVRPEGVSLDILIDPDYSGPRSLLAYAQDEGLTAIADLLLRYGAADLRRRDFLETQ